VFPPLLTETLRRLRDRTDRSGVALLLAALVLAVGCASPLEPATAPPGPASAAENELPTALPLVTTARPERPTPLPLSLPTAGPTPEALPTAAAPAGPTDAPEAHSDPSGSGGWDLVYLQDGTIYRGDYWGNDARPIVDVDQASTLALYDQRLAYDDLSSLIVADLSDGHVSRVEALPEDPTSNLHFVWASDGRALAYVLSREDPQAPSFGRSVDVGRVEKGSGGQAITLFTLPDCLGANLLMYDGPDEELLLVPQGDDPSFREAWLYDARTGARKATLKVEGTGVCTASIDGRRVLTTAFDHEQDVSQIRVYDLDDTLVMGPRVFLHGPSMHSVGHVWSSDGSNIAFLLRAGKSPWDDVGGALGVWALDTDSMQARQIAEETSLGSGPVASTPCGDWVVCYHLDAQGGSYYYAVRTDAADRVLLALGPQARIVGWAPSLPAVAKTTTPQASLAHVEELFARALSNPSLLAEGVATFLSLPEVSSMDDGQATSRLCSTLAQSGWEPPVTGQMAALWRLGGDLAALRLPPNDIYLFWAGGWQKVVTGDLIQDARLVGDELGLIFAQVGAGTVNPTFLLLRRQPAGGWDVVWSPAGQREWICTDGGISFEGEGLSALRLVGSSFGLDSGQDEVYSECHACPHRTLVSLWERRGEEYERTSALRSDASRAERLWEMTEPSAYASLYEFTRGLRTGNQAMVRMLAGSGTVVEQAREYGLADTSVRLVVESAEGGKVGFTAGETARQLAAELAIQEGLWRVLSITEVR